MSSTSTPTGAVVAPRAPVTVSHTTYQLLIALVVLIATSLVCVGALVMIRHARRHRRSRHALPIFRPHKDSSASSFTAGSAEFKGPHAPPSLLSPGAGGDAEKEALTASRPATPLPEIRIHITEEVDEAGKQQSPGRVVVVRIGARSVGLEPTEDDDLPPYRPLRDPRLAAAAAAAAAAERPAATNATETH